MPVVAVEVESVGDFVSVGADVVALSVGADGEVSVGDVVSVGAVPVVVPLGAPVAPMVEGVEPVVA
ncbi:hypothetical protein D3Y57_13115 [Sphingomonas paeninsulae]|uniref:Uncharacterized protein n=1 Tax=Sphingomonas paeninsulae TaxID=2319844 RepID=A0A494TMQ5_SPHPE|nr:hypothetical protein D3Y57_13115 [Sphingomonas paeninsulae]